MPASPKGKGDKKSPKKRKDDGTKQDDADAVPPPPPPLGDEFAMPVKEVRIPSNQLQLTEVQLDEEIAKMLKANNPEAPKNIARYNQKERSYKLEPMVEQLIISYSTDGWKLHKESDEARKQTEMEKLEREALNKFQAEVDKASKEKREDSAETEPPDDTKQLRNQFNFGERAAQTVNNPMRDRATSTEPVPTADMVASCSQFMMYDEYIRDLERQRRQEELNKAKAQAKKGVPVASATPAANESQPSANADPLGSRSMSTCAYILERMVNQNVFDEQALDFKYWNDPTDEVREQEGSLLPLWKFGSQQSKRKHVTAIAFNPRYPDLFAVGYGSYDYLRQASGMLCVFSFKTPTHPERQLNTDSGVMALDFHPQHANLLALGCYDGQVMVVDIRKRSKGPLYQAPGAPDKHTDMVSQVKWQDAEAGKPLALYSVSMDGHVLLWTIAQAALSPELAMLLRYPAAATQPYGLDEGDKAGRVGLLSGGVSMAVNTAKEVDHLFLVGTEDGLIHLCSKAYSSDYLRTFPGHNMAVYALKWNLLYPRMFLSASADWLVRLWDSQRQHCLMSFDLLNPVGDVAWAPYSATVFAAVCNDGKVRVYDLAMNRHEAVCEQQLVPPGTKLTTVVFSSSDPVLLVGDDRGTVHCVKLSPNLRRATLVSLEKGQSLQEVEQAKLDQVIEVAVKSSVAEHEG